MFSGDGLKLGSLDVGPGQQFVDLAIGMAVDNPGEDIGEIAERLDTIEFAGFDQRRNGCPVFGTAIGACKEGVLPVERHLGVILPMLGRRSRSIIAGIRISGAVFAASTAKSARRDASFTSSLRPAMSSPLRPG
jgi:hypothetical protein